MKKVESKFPDSKESSAIRIVLTVDSRSRVNRLTSSANDYTVKFATLNKIVAARLISAEIPNSQYVINSRNNMIDLTDGSGTYAVAITPGTYTALSLADEIDLRLNLALGLAPSVNFVVDYIVATQKMRITRILGGTFSILWISGASAQTSVAGLVGYTSDKKVVTTMSSDTIVNLAGENFVFLTIDRFDGLQNTEHIRDVFAKVIWNVPPRFICYDSFVGNVVKFREPLSNLDKLRVRFFQQDGSLYDFNGLDHSFSIELFVNA